MAKNAYPQIWNTVTSRRPLGTNVFSRDWDLLVILDACRVDSLRAAAGSLPWLDEVGSIRSVGSMSAEWMINTFTERHREAIEETAFVSGNLWSQRILADRYHEHENHDYDMLHKGWSKWDPVSVDDFAHYELVDPRTEQYDRLHPRGGIPNVRVDRAIAVAREQSFDRLVVHLGPPHIPFYSAALEWEPGEQTQEELMNGPDMTRELRPYESSYGSVKRGEISPEKVREAYMRHLRFGLEYVEILLNNIDAETAVISADHGEGLGEFGVWAHPWGFPFSPIKTVPWAVTTGSDEETYEPKHEPMARDPDESEQMQFLKEMGYV